MSGPKEPLACVWHKGEWFYTARFMLEWCEWCSWWKALLGFHAEYIYHADLHNLPCIWTLYKQGRSRWSGWSGFGQTTISQDKNKISFYRKQVVNKSTRAIFGLVLLVVLRYNR